MAACGDGAEMVVLSSDSEEKRPESTLHANGLSSDGADVRSDPLVADGGVKSVSKLSLKRKREISGDGNNGQTRASPEAEPVCAPNSAVASDAPSPSTGAEKQANSPASAEVLMKAELDTSHTPSTEQAKKMFDEFLHLCSTLTSDKDVIKFLQKRFHAADAVYLASQAFVALLTKRTEKLKESGKKEVFVHMKAVIDDLKANRRSESGSEKGKRKGKRKGNQSGQDSSTEFSDASESSSAKRLKADVGNLDEAAGNTKTEENGQVHDMIKEDGEKCGEGEAVKNEEGAAKNTQSSAVYPVECFTAEDTKASSVDILNNSTGDVDQAAQASSSNEDTAEDARKAKKRQKQLRRLEKLLDMVSKEIKHLEAKEVSLDDLDDEDSAYIQEDRLKKRFNTIWNKICELKGQEVVTGREVERRIKFKGTRFPEMNRRIMKFLRRSDSFPDFQDILAIIQKVNRKENLNLPPRHVHDLAKEAFTEIGDKFQRRRHRDLVQNFGSYLTDSFDPTKDPAREDPELQQKLRDNKMQGKRRLEEVLEKYTRQQYEMNLDGETAQGSDTEDPPVRGVADVETEEDLDEEEMEDEERLENSQVIEKVLEKEDSEEDEAMNEITVVTSRKARRRTLPAFPESDEGGDEEETEKMAGIEGGKQEGCPVRSQDGGTSRDSLGEASGIEKVEEETEVTATTEPIGMGVEEEKMKIETEMEVNIVTNEPTKMGVKEQTTTTESLETEENVNTEDKYQTEKNEKEDITVNDPKRQEGEITTMETIEILSSAESDVTDDSADWHKDEGEGTCTYGPVHTSERYPLSRYPTDTGFENGDSQESDVIAIETVDLEQQLCSQEDNESPEKIVTTYSKIQAQSIKVSQEKLQDLRKRVSSILAGVKSEPAEPSSSKTCGADSPSRAADPTRAALSQDTVSSSSGPVRGAGERSPSPDIIVISDSD